MKAPSLRSRTGRCCLISVTVIGIVAYSGIDETYSAGDLTRINRAASELIAACQDGRTQTAGAAVQALIAFERRDPTQPIPLAGAAPAVTMRAELGGLAATVSHGSCASDPSVLGALQRAAASRS
jgi:hypothetical protein